MMDKDAFVQYLKKRGKKPHVIEGLIRHIDKFTQYLTSKKSKGLGDATVQDIQDYADELEKQQPGAARKGVRGVALYFRFTGNETLAKAASDLREQAIAKTRKAFPLSEFMGVSPEHTACLEKSGIKHANELLAAGATKEARQELAKRTGIPMEAILELVKLADLSRMEGVKAIRARLYYDAGVDTVEKMAEQEPEGLLRLTREFVERTGFAGIPPLPKEAFSTIKTARELPKIIQLD